MGKTKVIRKAVRAEFGASPLVDDTDITVKNMKGDVTLTGVVANYQQYLEAAAAASQVAGVRNVRNHLEVVLLAEDRRDDAMLTTEANNTLRKDAAVQSVKAGQAQFPDPR